MQAAQEQGARRQQHQRHRHLGDHQTLPESRLRSVDRPAAPLAEGVPDRVEDGDEPSSSMLRTGHLHFLADENPALVERGHLGGAEVDPRRLAEQRAAGAQDHGRDDELQLVDQTGQHTGDPTLY
jgi:hypothetical protein